MPRLALMLQRAKCPHIRETALHLATNCAGKWGSERVGRPRSQWALESHREAIHAGHLSAQGFEKYEFSRGRGDMNLCRRLCWLWKQSGAEDAPNSLQRGIYRDFVGNIGVLHRVLALKTAVSRATCYEATCSGTGNSEQDNRESATP